MSQRTGPSRHESFSQMRIRPVCKSDCSNLADLIAELAEYERMSDLNHATPERIYSDKYKRDPSLFEGLIAEVKLSPTSEWVTAGSAIYVIGFSLR